MWMYSCTVVHYNTQIMEHFTIRQSSSIETFKEKLKHHLFML